MAIRITIFPPGDAGRPSVIAFDIEKIVVGRGAICDLRLPHPRVSYHHATIEVDGSRYSIRDMHSTNGTLVNGTRIPADFKQVIHSDDVIEIAGFRLVPNLSVPMEGTHSDERTEVVARSLLECTAPATEPARIEVVMGPDAGRSLELPEEGDGTVSVGHGKDCDLRLTDEQTSGVHIELRRTFTGWSLSAADGRVDVSGSPKPSARLSDGQLIELGATRIEFRDPLDAYYGKLLKTRAELEVEPPEPADDTGEALPVQDETPLGEDVPEITSPPAEETITSRSEVIDAGRMKSRMPEYSWMVVLLGVLAFLASLGLLLLMIF